MDINRFDEGRFDFGEQVRVIRNIRNDGTYPGLPTGTLLVRRGSIGNIVEVGRFLQDQIIFTVHFLEQGRMVGCRLEELIGLDEPWFPSLFEFREKVLCCKALAIGGEIIAPIGAEGEVIKVVRESERIFYHVAFHDRVLLVPEESLQAKESPV